MPKGFTDYSNDARTGTVGADGFVLSGATALGVIVPPNSVYHSGDVAPAAAATGTDTSPVVTETYISQVNIGMGATLTGLSLLNGSAVAGNVTLALADAAGNIVASTASTAQAGIGAYQQVPFTAPIAVKSGKYFVLATFNNTGAKFRSHAVGNFQAGKLTAQVYGTLAPFTPPVGFTANLGPLADTY